MLCPFAHPVACRCAKFDTDQTFQPTTPNISFVPWSLKRDATMLDPFAQLFQHCWGHTCSLHMVYKDLWVVSFLRCTTGPNIVGSCFIRLHTTTLSLFSSISGLEKFFQFQTVPSCDLLTILLVALSSWSFPVTILINSSKRTKRAATTSLKQMDWRIMILADFVTNSGRNLWLSWHFWIKNNTFK